MNNRLDPQMEKNPTTWVVVALCLVFVTTTTVITSGQEQVNTTLLVAAKENIHGQLPALVKDGSTVNDSEADGTTALHWVAYHDNILAADLLIKSGADVNSANDMGATPLWIASQNGSHAMVKTLLGGGANPRLSLLSGETPLMVASRAGAYSVVKELLDEGADADATATRDQTALMWAASEHHANVVDVLLNHGADIHKRSAVWSQVMAVPPHGKLEYNRDIPHGGNTALMFAARVGDLPSAKLLVTAGANVNDTNAWGVSATVLAAHSGYVELVEYLLDQGADPNLAAAGFGALHEAVMRRDKRMVAALLTHGADPNITLKTWTPTRRSSRDYNFSPSLIGATPFWLAARFAQPDLMGLLAEYGADPFFVHDVEYTPDSLAGSRAGTIREATTTLMAAVGMGGRRRLRTWVPPDRSQIENQVLESVKLMIELGVAINAANDDGRTALDGATALGYESVIDFLVEQGAQPGSI